MTNLFIKAYLFIAGLVMMLVGIYIALATNDYVAALTSQTENPSISMLSDLRGMGGMLLMLGTYVFISLFRKSWRNSGLIMATVVYTSFVLFRSLSFALDGLPEIGILMAYLIELILAVIGAFLIKVRAFDIPSNKLQIT